MSIIPTSASLNKSFPEKLLSDLSSLGIKEGDTLFVHSSLKGLQSEGLTPIEVIEALLASIGESGTLLMPAFTYQNVTWDNPFFSYSSTPSCVGVIPETFRKYPNVLRSLNPVHSVCARGSLAKELLSEHLVDNISIGPNSPILKLIEYGGKILMLGCGLKPNTFMHGIENTAPAPYRAIVKKVDYEIEDMDGNRFIYHSGLADMSKYEQRYDRVKQLLNPPELLQGKALGGEAWLMDAKALFNAGTNAIKENPYFFVEPIK